MVNYDSEFSQERGIVPTQETQFGTTGIGGGIIGGGIYIPGLGWFPGGGGFPGPGPGPGPGPFPPPPFPGPGPGPGPFPPPPFPGQNPFVTVVIDGGQAYPYIRNSYRIRYYPGLTLYQALQNTGQVQFGVGGRIRSVSGVPIGSSVAYELRVNGRLISGNSLFVQLNPNDHVSLRLILVGVPY
ncbi:hypothetical protein SY83_19725 [Paenibacillus swuensis]|uniref:Uncharacterized protein n=1 Tax=Paenibacillus swuensis TaxID=1178515 RepID=A0A172TM55_9BACL|nr:hypothetical protein [Paenibacillus swuensis]ANE48149.1 hypothetical protein SY83_19725 [Paenibacillus swuensis]